MIRARRSWIDASFGTLAVAAFVLAILPLWPAAPAHAVTDVLPDLVADPPAAPQLAVSDPGDGRNHLLLRFDGFIHNIGAGALEIRGSQPANGVMTVTGQRIYRDDSSFRDDSSRHPQIYFENSDGHMHWHVKGAARFSLWNQAGTAEAATAAKVGFCLEDVDRVDAFAPPNPAYSSDDTGYCAQGEPDTASISEGISPGWRDVYAAKLPFQWVDVSDVAPGRYRLGAQVDPDDFALESNEANNGPTLAAATVLVPGYVAASGPVTVTRPETIVLSAAQFGSPGPRTFTIESAPRHGSLSTPAGAPFAGPEVLYTPKPGFAGSDTFTYSARDSASPYPFHSPVATVSVTVPGRVRAKLLTKLRFTRRGRFLFVHARAGKSGLLKITIKKGKRRLGSCRKRVRSGHRFRCAVKLRRHASPRRGKAVVRLLQNGKQVASGVYRIPRRLGKEKRR